VKQKYGASLSWADLMVLAGNVSLEQMGFKTFGFAGGRKDDWQAELVYWGPEAQMLADQRYSGERNLEKPLAAVQMGLIYVNPEGPNGNPDPLAAAKDIRETFGRMAMNDEETVALIAGGHTFGKAHGARSPKDCVGVEPAAGPVHAQGMGWTNTCGAGSGADTITSGLEGAWTSTPVAFSTQYLDNLYAFEWVKTKSPAGATQWVPKDDAAKNLVPDAHDPSKRHAPVMFTTDLALRFDPEYAKISKRFQEDPEAFKDAFARAWFKLTHRDMGPKTRYVGADAPAVDLIWQDPTPAVDHALVTPAEATGLKSQILASGLTTPELVRTAWSSAASFRDTDMRGGANGARVRLAPQKDWAANNPAELARAIAKLDAIRGAFNGRAGGKTKISLADMIVLGGVAAVEKAARDAGHPVDVAFRPGRTDAAQAQTDAASFSVLEPYADGFRNYYSQAALRALVGGMRALDANVGGADHGVFTGRPGVLSNDFFVNLLDMGIQWAPKSGDKYVYEGRDRKTADVKWTATEVDLVFGSNAELRAVAEHYASAGGGERLARDFAAAWTKVMEADRFDLKRRS
jgi:catalase-peroxidase